MADEVRRSGRANKGHHTKHQDDEQPVTTPKSKLKAKNEKSDKKGGKTARGQSTQTPEQEEEDEEEEEEEDDDPNAIIRCVCGNQVDNGRQMICCEQCDAWQHVRCLGLKEGKHWDTATYFCEQCKPEDHVELLAAMSRGETPWKDTKGSKKKKGSVKPKSARPSDVKPEVEKQAATPQPPATPKETPKETPAPGPEPVSGPIVVAAELSKATNKPTKPTIDSPAPQTKKETPAQPEPQSPREKRRRDTIAEKDNAAAAAKRRKSSAQHEKPAQTQEPATDPAALPDKQKTIVLKLIDEISKTVKEASKSRGYRIPDGQTPSSLATQLALHVHHSMIVNLGEPSDNQSPYSIQLRSIMFNIKKNSVLVDRLLSGSLPAEGLATMAAEDMASEDKQREYAQMREAAEKQMTLVEETGPRLRKTHKGEEIVGEDNMEIDTQPAVPESRGSVQEERPPLDPAPTDNNGSPAVELPEDAVAREPLTVDTASAQAPKPASNFDVQAIFNKVRSPHGNQQFLPRRQSSIQEQPPEGPGIDADIDRLLKDEDGDVAMTDFSSSDPTIVWQGALDMQSLGPFDAVARFVAGGDLGQVMPWNRLLSSSLPIQGRIENAKGDEYIKGLAASDTHDVGVLAVTPVTEEGRVVMDRLFEYFWPRKRWGVVPVDKLGSEAMRDLYVIPLEAGGTNLPPFLELLEYCTIETPRRDNMILLALVAKLPEPAQQPASQHPFNQHLAGETPQPMPPTNGSTNGPSPSPVPNPHAPQFSPLQSAFPSNAPYSNPFAAGTPVPPQNGQTPQAEAGHNVLATPQLNSKAVEIFGPYINAPAVVAVMNHNNNLPEWMMLNLRVILEEVPATRDDTMALLAHMKLKNEGAKGSTEGTKVEG